MRSRVTRASFASVLVLALAVAPLVVAPATATGAAPIFFEKMQTVVATGGGTIVDIGSADMDGDWGGVEIVVVTKNPDRILVYPTSSGSLGTPASYTLSFDPTCLYVRDLDADGNADVLVGYASGGVGIHWGKGDGTIDAVRSPIYVNWGLGPVADVAMMRCGPGLVGDIVATVPAGDRLFIVRFEGTAGNPTIGTSTGFVIPGAHGITVDDFAAYPPATEDFNDDIAVTQSGSSGVRLIAPNSLGTLFNETVLNTGAGPTGVYSGFINNNSLPQDLIVANTGANTVQAKMDDGWGSWTNQTINMGAGWQPTCITWCVADTAGRGDYAVLSEAQDEVAFLTNVDGTLTKASYALPVRASASRIWSTDLSGDDRPELFVCGGSRIDVYRNLAWPSMERWAGLDRYETCVAVSQIHNWPADTVVIATGENFPDALAGGPLATASSGTLLLTKPNELPDVVAGEIGRLGASTAYVLGGTSVISTAVEADLAAAGITTVTRLAGADRYETAKIIAEEIQDVVSGIADIDKAFIATGENFPDALAAGPFGGDQDDPIPILLTRPGSLPEPTQQALVGLGIADTWVLGGTAAVGEGVYGQLPSPMRLSGANRYETARAIAEWGETNRDARMDQLVLATGANFPDALSVAAVIGVWHSPLLLTEAASLPDATAAYVDEHQNVTSSVVLVGGTSVVSDDIYDQVLDLY